MPKKGLFYILVFIILFTPTLVSAKCSNAEKVRLASLAGNVSVTYDYIETDTGVTFNVVFTNLQPDFYILDVTNQTRYYYTSNELVLYNYQPSTNYRFDIYGTGECESRLYSHYITPPGYNPYYRDPVCNGVDASICQKWVKVTYDYNTFVNEVNKYKNKNNDIIVSEEEKVMGLYDYILELFIKYYYIALPIIIVSGSAGIIILSKKKKDELFY